ncbi:MAG: hypothetical protein VX768_19260 [Planctomycetota bacterium]|nr:hypothetical protein [Planctomycetota bacterium]
MNFPVGDRPKSALLLFRLLPAVWMLLTGILPLAAQDLPPTDQESIRELILQLDEVGSVRERKQVLARLESLGRQVLPTLEHPPGGLSQQTRLLLRQLRNRLEKSDNQKLASGTRASLEGFLTAKQACAELTRQTGLKIQLDAAPGQVTRFDGKEASFWSLVDLLMKRYQLEIAGDSPVRGLRLVPKTQKRGPTLQASEAGVYRIEPVRFRSRRIADGEPVDRDILTVRFRWEPMLSPFQLEFDFGQLVATVPSGQSFASTRSSRLRTSIRRNQSNVELEIPFRPFPTDEVEFRLGGSLSVTAPVGQHSFEFENVFEEKSKPLRKADMRVRIDSTEKNGSDRTLDMSFLLENAGQALDSHHGWMFENRGYLVDGNSRVISSRKMLTILQEKDKMGFRYFFELPQGAEGIRFIYQTPTSIRKIPQKFQLPRIRLK